MMIVIIVIMMTVSIDKVKAMLGGFHECRVPAGFVRTGLLRPHAFIAAPMERTMVETRKLISVLVADDHQMVRLGLVQMLEADTHFSVVAEACNGLDAVAEFNRVRPDLVIIDLMMPQMNGIEAIRKIRLIDHQARIIIISGSDGEEHIYRSFEAGASAYLLKNASEEQLMDCLNAVASGRKFLPPAIAAKLAARFDNNKLSPREQEILRYLSAGLSNKMIARAANIAEGTVKFHVNSILSKMDVSSRTEAARQAIKRGIVDLNE